MPNALRSFLLIATMFGTAVSAPLALSSPLAGLGSHSEIHAAESQDQGSSSLTEDALLLTGGVLLVAALLIFVVLDDEEDAAPVSP